MGFAIAFIVIGLIVIGCRAKEMKNMNSKNAHEKMYLHKIKKTKK